MPGLTIKMQDSLIKCNQSDSEGHYKLISTTMCGVFDIVNFQERFKMTGRNITVNLKKMFDVCQVSKHGSTGDCIKKKHTHTQFIQKIIKMHCLVGTRKNCKFSTPFFG